MTRKETLLAKYGESYYSALAKRVKNRRRFTPEQARAAQAKSVESRKHGKNKDTGERPAVLEMDKDEG